MHFTLSTLDIAIIIVSLVAVVAVGLWAARKQDKTARGYFLASGRLPWFSSFSNSAGATSESAATTPSPPITVTLALVALAREAVSAGASRRSSRISLPAMSEATRASSCR